MCDLRSPDPVQRPWESTHRPCPEKVSLDQKTARVFGVLYLITFLTSIPALLLCETALRHPVSYIAGGGHDNQVLFAAPLELLLIIATSGPRW